MTGKRQSHEELDAHHFHRGWRHVEHGGLAAEGDLPVEGRPSRPKGGATLRSRDGQGGDLAVEGVRGQRLCSRRDLAVGGWGDLAVGGKADLAVEGRRPCGPPRHAMHHTHSRDTPTCRAPPLARPSTNRGTLAAHTALPLAHTHLLLPPCPLTAAPSATVPLGNPLPPTRACASTLPARICIDEPPPRLVTCSIAATMPRPPRPREGVNEFQLRGGVRLVKPPVVHRIVEDAPPRDALSCRR